MLDEMGMCCVFVIRFERYAELNFEFIFIYVDSKHSNTENFTMGISPSVLNNITQFVISAF
jgi:hypothetical protein